MSNGRLVLHRGAREVSHDYLARVPTPSPSRRWFPVGHATFVDSVDECLTAQGFTIERRRYGLSGDDARLFGVYDLTVPVAEGVSVSVGIRNSLDQTFPLGFCAGHRVFICDNLAFSAELMTKRKHTRFGHDRFRDDILACVAQLDAFQAAEAFRIRGMREAGLSDTEAESVMLRALERRLISPRLVYKLIEAWREPPFEAFEPRTAWSLFNAFTLVMSDRARTNPTQHARDTMSLQTLLAPRGGDEPGMIDVDCEVNHAPTHD